MTTTTRKPRRMARPSTLATASDDSAGAPPDKRPTKQNLVLDLLQRDGGVPLAAIVAATGWQNHTARAALTGLRKKGHAITRSKNDGETRYAVTMSVAP